MKKLAVMIVLVLGFLHEASAQTLMYELSGTLVNRNTKDDITMKAKKLKAGKYRYVLKISGHKKAKMRFRVHKKRLSGIWQKLVDMKIKVP